MEAGNAQVQIARGHSVMDAVCDKPDGNHGDADDDPRQRRGVRGRADR